MGDFRKKNKKKIFTIISLLVIGIICIIAIVFLNKSTKSSDLAKKDSLKTVSKSVQIKRVKGTDIIKGMNITVDGEKYADNGQAIQEVLRHGKNTVDGKKIAYLTFDDGPSTTVTPKILEVLKQKKVKATFFIVGSALAQNDECKKLLKEEIEEGNAIANHSYTHNYHHLYPERVVNTTNFMDEITKTNNLMKSVLGENFDTKIIRFPGGHMSWKGTKAIDPILEKDKYSFIDWNSLTGDAEGRHKKNPEELLQHLKLDVNEKIKPDRLVVLMHDTYGKENTAIALPSVIDYLKSLGYQFRTIKN